MRTYYVRIRAKAFDPGDWFHTTANSKKEIQEAYPHLTFEEIITAKEAEKRAENEPALAKAIESNFLCDMMCT